MEDVVPGSPSSLSSDNSDSDGVNTSSAKIYFGQFQSPEKKLAALVDSTSSAQPTTLDVGTPRLSSLRRSTRLSSSPVRNDTAIDQSEQEEEDDDEDEAALTGNRGGEIRKGPWQDTPFLEFLRKDEPSSAIASRIMRAHDNPSPPPKALRTSLTPRSSSNSFAGLVFPHISNSEESSDAAVESLLQPDNPERGSITPPPMMDNVSALPTPTIQQPLRSPMPCAWETPSSTPATQANAEADLISFDRSVLISSSPDGAKLHSPSPQHAQQLTIDDLLFSSPPQAIAPDQEPRIDGRENIQTTANDGAGLPERESEAEGFPKERVPAIDVPESEREHPEVEDLVDKLEIALPSPDRWPQPKLDQNENQKTPVARLPIPDPSPSLRRSPRLSSLPLPTPQVTPRLSTPCRTPKAKTPNSGRSQAHKRCRSGSEKAPRASLSPKKLNWPVESEESGNETELFQTPSKKARRDRKRVKQETPSNEVDANLAESLSPGSAQILSSLVSSETLASTSQSDIEMVTPSTPRRPESITLPKNNDTNSPVKPPAPLPSTSIQRPPPGVFTPYIVTPARGSSSRSFLAPNSPVKSTLTPAPCDDPNRTPARRVPIKEVNSMSVSRPPVFSRPPSTGDTIRGSAKRVPASAMAPKEPTLRPESNTTSLSSTSTSRSRSVSVEAPESRPNAVENKRAIGVETSNVPSSTPAIPGPLSQKVFLMPTNGSTVSNTSKPASKPESRIPRPGTTSKPAPTQKSKLPMPSARKPNGLAKAPSRLPSPKKAPLTRVAQLHNSSSSGSDDSVGGQPGASGMASSRRALNNTLAKRKRDVEKPAPARPMMKMRQVIPGMYGGPIKTALNGTEKTPVTEEQQPPASPAKPIVQPRPIKVREVVRGTLQDFELKTPSFKSLEALSERRAREREELEKAKQEAQKESSPPAPSLEAFTFECSVPENQGEQMDVDSATPSAGTSDSLPPSDDVIDMEMRPRPAQGPSNETSARRSSRARRPSSADVFGAVSSNVPGQSSSRRRSGAGQSRPKASSLPPNLIFSTSGLALKTLTNSNTTRNQHYHAQLEMHIVRKAGERPESPTMKLRTIVEKQKEDQDKMRAERARRRRGEGSNESGDIDMAELADSHPSKHRRGPGDEGDYETPVRPNDGRKAVKWDRGLEASVFLDEIEVQPWKRRAGEGASMPRKGCLVSASNRAPLDGLGNPVNADAPLNLVPEKVVVTKYIYDNDEEALLFEPPPPKITRSKSKKK